VYPYHFGRNQPGDIDSTLAPCIKLGISIPGIHIPFPEYRATLNDIVHPEDSDWFYPLPGNLERKKELFLAQSPRLFGTSQQLIIRTKFFKRLLPFRYRRNHTLSKISIASSKST
jgi:hypothetical protein